MDIGKLQQILAEIAGDRRPGCRPKPLTPSIQRMRGDRKTPDGDELFLDDYWILRDLAMEIDEEEDAERAWSIVSDNANSRTMTRPLDRDDLSRAVGANLQRCTVPLCDVESQEKKVATGTLVLIGDSLFVVTAAHCLRGDAAKRIMLMDTEARPLEPSTRHILRYGRCELERPDVGFLELRRDWLREELRHEPITLDRVRPCGSGKERYVAYIFGYPSDIVKVKPVAAHEGHVEFQGQCYPHLPILLEDWEMIRPSCDPKYTPDPAMDVFLPYLIGEEMIHLGENVGPGLSSPPGLSGGGVWQRSTEESAIWTAENYELIAVQSMWPRRGRYLQATQIIHWLRLVYASCVDARRPLMEQFPDQAFVA